MTEQADFQPLHNTCISCIKMAYVTSGLIGSCSTILCHRFFHSQNQLSFSLQILDQHLPLIISTATVLSDLILIYLLSSILGPYYTQNSTPEQYLLLRYRDRLPS